LLAGELNLLKNKVRDRVGEGRGNWESTGLGLEAIFIGNIGQVEFTTIGVGETNYSLFVTIIIT